MDIGYNSRFDYSHGWVARGRGYGVKRGGSGDRGDGVGGRGTGSGVEGAGKGGGDNRNYSVKIITENKVFHFLLRNWMLF